MKRPIPQRMLVVQPDDGVDPVLGLLADATESLRVKQFTLSEPRLVQDLIDAHRRGVSVRVMLNPHWSSGDRPNDAVFRRLQQAGFRVHRQKHLKLYAKFILGDGKRALLGSMNIDRSAFDLRRELGISVDGEPIIERLSHIFSHEWDHSHCYEVPDPLEAEKPAADELPHDPEFRHE
jgi:cardiolipin synthase